MKTHASCFHVAIFVAVLGSAVAFGVMFQDKLDSKTLEASITGLGEWAAFAFVTGFALATVLFVPGSLFGLAGGALFGPLWGTILNLLGATLGATIAFLLARHTGADWIAARTGGRLKRIVAGVEAEGWRFVAMTRLVPIVPFNEESAGWISVSELKERLSGGAPPAVIDVRGPEEFNGPLGHIPDALNVPLGELETRLAVLASDRRQMVFVCKTDKRSAKAAEILRAHGIKHVMVLRGGMEEWSRHAAVSQAIITPI